MSAVVIPAIVSNDGNRKLSANQQLKVEGVTFADLGLVEADIEEFVCNNLAQILGGEEDSLTMTIVGRQVLNKEGGRSDLVALDDQGNLVVIEIKRDVKDCISRAEPFEFQAIRYAANYSQIRSREEILDKLYVPYIEKYEADKIQTPNSLSSEYAKENLNRLLSSVVDINRKQRIILISSDFDAQALSACAWLHQNGIDITCIKLAPMRYGEQVIIMADQLLPPPLLEQFIVPVTEPSASRIRSSTTNSDGSRATLPTMPQLKEWGIIREGDMVYIRDRKDKAATIVSAKLVQCGNRQMLFNEWAKDVTGWKAVNIYEWTILDREGKTLDQLRREKQRELEAAALGSQQIAF